METALGMGLADVFFQFYSKLREMSS